MSEFLNNNTPEVPLAFVEVVPEEDINNNDPSPGVEFVSYNMVEHFWCSYCGGWHGNGLPPGMEGVEPTPAPSVPQVLGRIIEKVVSREVEAPPMRTKEQGTLNGQPALLRRGTDTGHVDVFWGGEGQRPDGPKHGHIASSDGLNANYVREPGDDREVVVNDNWPNPYVNPSIPPQDAAGRYDFS